MKIKPYLTPEEQADLLRSRGLIVTDEEINYLYQIGYYRLINGYKDAFLDYEKMSSRHDDIYKDGVSLTDIFLLFEYDRCIGNILLSYIKIIEIMVKASCVNAFCSKFGSGEEYLDRKNYVDSKHYLMPRRSRKDRSSEFEKNINKLLGIFSEINCANTDNYGSRYRSEYIQHYRKEYGYVPLWVVMKTITFGSCKNFYQLQKQTVQNAICQQLAEENNKKKRFSPQELLRALDIIVGFRNLCAHSERIYCARVKGAGFDLLLHKMFMFLPDGLCQGLFEQILNAGNILKGSNSIDASVMNAMYTNSDDIPEEFRK